MPNIHVLTGAGESPAQPVIRKIGVADLKDAVAKGIDDFMAMPTHVMFLAVIYPLVGLFLAAITFGYNIVPLLYPLAAGFALIDPLLVRKTNWYLAVPLPTALPATGYEWFLLVL